MDPLAHTLVGAALAETGLKRFSRYATATLLIGVNLPDIDGVTTLLGNDAALYWRRGWSHGVLALMLLPLLLAGAVWLWHRWRGHQQINAPPLRMGVIVALSFLAVWSHPLLDWMNTYGVRLLMPFDGRWFYGDTLFIIEPWLWLLAAAGVVLARSAPWPAITGWCLLAVLTSGMVLMTNLAPPLVKIFWLLGLVTIFLLRWRNPSPAFARLVAQASFATLVLYVCMAYGMARVAESAAAALFPAPLETLANPIPGAPTQHRMILVYDGFYRVVMPDGEIIEVPRPEPSEVVQQALASDSIRGFVTWMRHPYWEVEDTADGWLVHFRDLRYINPHEPARGFGSARVFVPRAELELDDSALSQ